jgi:hypothetical protein
LILEHYIDFLDGNGFVEVQPPQEWKKFSIQLSFEEGNERLSSSNFSWVGDNAEYINNYISGGSTGVTNGIFEGLPYQIRFTCDSIQYTILDACVNLASSEAKYSCEEVNLPIREKGKIDFLNDVADSFRFAYLFAIRQNIPPFGNPVAGQITYNDFIDVWYVQGQYPQKFEIMLASVTLYVTLKETFEVVKRIGDVVADLFNIPTGGIVSALKLVLLIIYLVLLIIALIELFQKLIDLIFPFVYFHRAMYVKTLFEKACEYLGFNFSSSIFDVGGLGYNEYILPEKNEEGKKVGNNSIETGFFNGTFGDLIRGYKEKYNAEIKIIGNTLHFEHEDYFIDQSNFVIPNVYQKPNNEFTYNASEVPANYVISYRYDVADLNNLSFRFGTQFTARIEPATITNRQNILLSNLDERNIPFTIPNIKTFETDLEKTMTKVFNGIAELVNTIASVVGNSTPIPSIPFGGNQDILILDTHLTSSPKIGIYQGGGKTNPLSVSNYLDAEILWNRYHASRSAYGFPPFQSNQWKIYKDVEIPLCCEDYLILKNNNYATYQGNDARIESIDWNPYDQVAKITFRVRNVYTTNLKLIATNSENVSTVYQ